jgi:dihydropteroate synthase
VPKLKKEKRNFSDFSTSIVMGILNITTDSFYDGGKYLTKENIISQIKKIEKEGAKIIDIGASSSRPGSKPVSEKIELERLIPAIKLVKENSSKLMISISTIFNALLCNSRPECVN